MNQLTELCPSCGAQWNCKYVIKERKIKDNNTSIEISCTLKMGRTEVDKKIKFFGAVLERNKKQRIRIPAEVLDPLPCNLTIFRKRIRKVISMVR